RTLRTWGLAESTLAERIAPRLDALDRVPGGPTIAFLASGIEGIKGRVTARASGPDAEEVADKALDAEEAELRSLLGPVVFGVDDDTMEVAVGRLLLERGWTMAVAESLTGGLIGSRLTNAGGASDFFRGGVISYASDVKRSLLGVGDGPVVSESAAMEMARGAAAVLGADVGLAVTGVAGPTEQDGQPVGTVWVGLSLPGRDPEARQLWLPGDRDRVRQMTAISALDALRHALGHAL
ncbi:MAG: nicotinamide-nucleotide amidohydrolase family protein, partial [Acidimicrobiaceae bacterium]|nr:nicotinamide-nucleotide amidohydrolase family protein [Acidimicrobiaceae bacterium]